ncbi:serine hydrolase domain-containing protein [Lentzea sp. NPDC054927]
MGSLDQLIAKYDVPNAQVAVLAGGEITTEGTTDSAFRIGSITKIWTATLVQRLVDEGALDLDRPVRDYLPGFRLRDHAADALTSRHLLTHTGGLDSNHFVDTGSMEEFVAALADAEHWFPPGEVFSYSNSGFRVLGRLVEVLRGKPYDDVLHTELVTPLGLRTVSANAIAPGSSHLEMTARDLLEFVRLHLTDPALAALREPQLDDIPDFGGDITGWGLGWMLYPGGTVGHTGVSKGQKSFLRVVPAQGLAVAVLTDSPRGEPLAHEIFTAAGIECAPPPSPPADPAPVDEWMCGTYRNTLYDLTLATEDGCAFLTYHARTERFPGKPAVEVVRHGKNTIITAEPKPDGHHVMSLVGSDELGRANFLHNGSAAWRIA